MSNLTELPEVGTLVDLRDPEGIWSGASVVNVSEPATGSTAGVRIELKYYGWETLWNETIIWDTQSRDNHDRIARLFTYSRKAKSMVRLFPKVRRPAKTTNDKKPKSVTKTSEFWPCTVYFRMPEPSLVSEKLGTGMKFNYISSELLKMEPKVYVEPYAADSLRKKHRYALDESGGVWVKATNIFEFDTDLIQNPKAGFNLALEEAELDLTTHEVESNDVFETGSLLCRKYRVQAVGSSGNASGIMYDGKLTMWEDPDSSGAPVIHEQQKQSQKQMDEINKNDDEEEKQSHRDNPDLMSNNNNNNKKNVACTSSNMGSISIAAGINIIAPQKEDENRNHNDSSSEQQHHPMSPNLFHAHTTQNSIDGDDDQSHAALTMGDDDEDEVEDEVEDVTDNNSLFDTIQQQPASSTASSVTSQSKSPAKYDSHSNNHSNRKRSFHQQQQQQDNRKRPFSTANQTSITHTTNISHTNANTQQQLQIPRKVSFPRDGAPEVADTLWKCEWCEDRSFDNFWSCVSHECLDCPQNVENMEGIDDLWVQQQQQELSFVQSQPFVMTTTSISTAQQFPRNSPPIQQQQQQQQVIVANPALQHIYSSQQAQQAQAQAHSSNHNARHVQQQQQQQVLVQHQHQHHAPTPRHSSGYPPNTAHHQQQQQQAVVMGMSSRQPQPYTASNHQNHQQRSDNGCQNNVQHSYTYRN